MKLKAEGVKKGYPDLVLDVARGRIPRLEGRAEGAEAGVVKPEQARSGTISFAAQGYRVDVRHRLGSDAGCAHRLPQPRAGRLAAR
jgi:hypothetical protein